MTGEAVDDAAREPTRTAILDAARDLLVADGPDGLTVRRIAGAAGHSTMAVYSRFGGKDGIVDALVAEGFTMLTADLGAVGTGDDPVADLHRMGEAYRRFAHEHPRHYSLMFERPVPGYEPSGRTSEVADGALGVLVRALDRAMATGALAPGDPAVTAVSVWATAHGLVSLELAGAAAPVVDWDTAHEHTWSALFAGLAPPP